MAGGAERAVRIAIAQRTVYNGIAAVGNRQGETGSEAERMWREMERLRALMKREGVDEWGVCRMADLLPLLNVRAANRLTGGEQTAIILLFGYYVGEYANRNISRYAIVDDYHTVVRAKLEKLAQKLSELYNGERFIPFIDSSPVAEVRAACLAGLGETGLNGQLLNPVYGSYCFIGELVTTADLPANSCKVDGLCTRCGRCIAACPTGALTAEGFFRERCRSHITQKKGALTGWEREQVQLGGYVWGCDRCTDACPVNRSAKPSALSEFYRDIVPVAGEDNVGNLCRTKAYGWRGEKVLLRNLELVRGGKQRPGDKNG